jgi:hypothetical protein
MHPASAADAAATFHGSRNPRKFSFCVATSKKIAPKPIPTPYPTNATTAASSSTIRTSRRLVAPIAFSIAKCRMFSITNRLNSSPTMQIPVTTPSSTTDPTLIGMPVWKKMNLISFHENWSEVSASSPVCSRIRRATASGSSPGCSWATTNDICRRPLLVYVNACE